MILLKCKRQKFKRETTNAPKDSITMKQKYAMSKPTEDHKERCSGTKQKGSRRETKSLRSGDWSSCRFAAPIRKSIHVINA